MHKHDNYEIQSQLALPYLSTRNEVIEGIFKILETKFGLKRRSKQVLVDLGSGNGRVVIFSGFNYKIKSIGIEINKELVKEANLSLKSLKWMTRRYISFKNDDFFSQDLKKYDFIYIFSLPSMHKFLPHLFRTIKSGAVIISYKYPLLNMKEYNKSSDEFKIKGESVFFYLIG